MNDVILNVAVAGGGHGSSWYARGAERLRASLEALSETADKLFFTKWPDTPHSVTPYAFKVDAFIKAREQGYERAIWFDASCYLVRPLDQAWAQITDDGYLLGQEGWDLGQWCNDETLDKALLTREQAHGITLIEGKMMGLDLTSDVGNAFLDAWDQASIDGWFNGSHVNHRHDISAGAIIADRMGLHLTPHLIEYEHRGPVHPSVYVRASGM